jgi:hypothetical protein
LIFQLKLLKWIFASNRVGGLHSKHHNDSTAKHPKDILPGHELQLVDELNGWDEEGQRLARPGLGRSDQVPALQKVRDGFGLETKNYCSLLNRKLSPKKLLLIRLIFFILSFEQVELDCNILIKTSSRGCTVEDLTSDYYLE